MSEPTALELLVENATHSWEELSDKDREFVININPEINKKNQEFYDRRNIFK